MDKYNYVILGSDWDLYKFSYSDLYQFNNVQYIPGPYPPINSLKGLLYRIHFNPTINRLVKLPFKTAWNDSYFKHRFPVSKPFCFIVFMNWIKQDVGITTYLREKFPNAKLVCILQDLASTHPFYCNNLKKQFDLVLSFDPGDCATYGFIYHPLVYSSYHGKIKKMPYSDVYMLAKAKNRLNDIFKIYTILKDNNLKPNLLLAGVDIQDQKYKDEITYLNKSIPYEENLQYIFHTHCILEVMQKNGIGFTQRACEAVCLGKKLLTNNPHIKNEPFFNLEYILYANVFVSIPKAGYHYVQNPQSICHTQINLASIVQNKLQVFRYYKELYTKLGLYDQVQPQLYKFLTAFSENAYPSGSPQKIIMDMANRWGFGVLDASDKEKKHKTEPDA